MEAYAKFAPENSKWTKHTVAEHVALGGNGPIMVGTASKVADQLQQWVDEADVDGFNFVSSLASTGPLSIYIYARPRTKFLLTAKKNHTKIAGLRAFPRFFQGYY